MYVGRQNSGGDGQVGKAETKEQMETEVSRRQADI